MGAGALHTLAAGVSAMAMASVPSGQIQRNPHLGRGQDTFTSQTERDRLRQLLLETEFTPPNKLINC